MSPSHRFQRHESLWDSRLQDCLDDRLAPGERPEIEDHLTTCGHCCERRADLRRVDEALRAWSGRPVLNESFDRRLLALVDAQAAL